MHKLRGKNDKRHAQLKWSRQNIEHGLKKNINAAVHFSESVMTSNWCGIMVQSNWRHEYHFCHLVNVKELYPCLQLLQITPPHNLSSSHLLKNAQQHWYSSPLQAWQHRIGIPNPSIYDHLQLHIPYQYQIQVVASQTQRFIIQSPEHTTIRESGWYTTCEAHGLVPLVKW